MPKSKKIPKIKLPMNLYWNEKPKNKFMTEQQAIKVEMTDYPKGNFRMRCAKASMSTWNYKPIKIKQNKANEIFKEILTYKMLPNTMESLIFSFRFNNLTHIDISHILRHRLFFSITAVCSGDRDLRHDWILIPNSIKNSKFKNRYIKLSEECKQLYSDIVDSKEVSLMDARFILNRNHLYDYNISMNLKDAISFINQRKCTQIQPYTDNLMAKGVYDNIIKIIPELKNIISLKCNSSCHYVRTANTGKATNLYLPDKAHDCFDWNPDNFIYKKRRYELGIPKTIQDE